MSGVNWVSVKEKIPKIIGSWSSKRILCFSPTRRIETGRMLNGGIWRSDSGADITDRITHWMKLPEPPNS